MKNEKTKCFAVLLIGLSLAGCGRSSQDNGGAVKQDDEDVTPEQRKYLDAAKPFADALANRRYDEAHALLSSYATARMSLNQFAPEDDEAKFAQHERNAVANVTAEQFRELMKRAEGRFGTPRSLTEFHVFSTDPGALDRRGKEGFDALDAMFAVGMIPDSVPAAIRRASIRGRILTQLSPQELEKIAKEEGITVEELQKSEDFAPYFTVKLVLVEQDGQFKVGYFEFLPPGIMD